ncbi:MAG: hypothetical protein IJH38_06140 [Clostridia bacterium]|nr:hypothetical protein [Clostridia bacterium]
MVNYMMVAVLTASDNSYMTWERLTGNPALFPFSVVHVTQADAAACERLRLERMGGDTVIRLA